MTTLNHPIIRRRNVDTFDLVALYTGTVSPAQIKERRLAVEGSRPVGLSPGEHRDTYAYIQVALTVHEIFWRQPGQGLGPGSETRALLLETDASDETLALCSKIFLLSDLAAAVGLAEEHFGPHRPAWHKALEKRR